MPYRNLRILLTTVSNTVSNRFNALRHPKHHLERSKTPQNSFQRPFVLPSSPHAALHLVFIFSDTPDKRGCDAMR